MRYNRSSDSCLPARTWIAGAAALTILSLVLLTSKRTTEVATFGSITATDYLLDDIHNETLGFQKIFAINLPSRSDHRDAMSLAAALTNLTIQYVDGVTDVSEKTLPPGRASESLEGELGNWRAHMNVARLFVLNAGSEELHPGVVLTVGRIVEQNISSALVLEDDADWDLRIKSQMRDFARATRLLIQPTHHGEIDEYLDPTYPKTTGNEEPSNFYVGEASTTMPTTSPYGDLHRWDLLWIGHCGTRFPTQAYGDAPLGRAVILDDATVPEPQHVHMQFGTGELVEQYPPHTRVVSRAMENVCTLGYALSNAGARRLLYELSLRKLDHSTDVSMREACDGKNGRPGQLCFTVQPQLFQHHRPVGNKKHESDISPHPDVYNEHAYTRNIRWSTRLNIEKLLDKQTDYIDLFKDGTAPVGLDW